VESSAMGAVTPQTVVRPTESIPEALVQRCFTKPSRKPRNLFPNQIFLRAMICATPDGLCGRPSRWAGRGARLSLSTPPRPAYGSLGAKLRCRLRPRPNRIAGKPCWFRRCHAGSRAYPMALAGDEPAGAKAPPKAGSAPLAITTNMSRIIWPGAGVSASARPGQHSAPPGPAPVQCGSVDCTSPADPNGKATQS